MLSTSWKRPKWNEQSQFKFENSISWWIKPHFSQNAQHPTATKIQTAIIQLSASRTSFTSTHNWLFNRSHHNFISCEGLVQPDSFSIALRLLDHSRSHHGKWKSFVFNSIRASVWSSTFFRSIETRYNGHNFPFPRNDHNCVCVRNVWAYVFASQLTLGTLFKFAY